MIICAFDSPLDLVDRATHYAVSDPATKTHGTGPVSKIVKRDCCPYCGRTAMIGTDSGVGATFVRRHEDCIARRFGL